MRQNLLLISSNSSARGGGERYLVYLAQGLQALGCQVHALLSCKDYMDPWAQDLTAVGAIVHRRPLIGLRDRPLRFIQSVADKKQQELIADFCRELSPTAILVNQQYDEDGLDYLAGALRARVAPVAGVIHMPMTATKNQRPLGKWRGHVLQSWYARYPYQLVFVSQGGWREFYTYYEKLGQNGKVIHYGCPFSEVNPLKPELPPNWNDGSPVIGCLCQFVPQKNLELLVDAWFWLRQRGSMPRLLLVGDGPQRSYLESRLSKAAPVGSWLITGWQTQPEAYLAAIDLYVMTSHFEGLPLSLLEAAGQGIPSVVTNFNGAAEVAEKASWVQVVTESTVLAVGQAMESSLGQLSHLKHQACINQPGFQAYFSVERMAQDTLAVLGIVQ